MVVSFLGDGVEVFVEVEGWVLVVLLLVGVVDEVACVDHGGEVGVLSSHLELFDGEVVILPVMA